MFYRTTYYRIAARCVLGRALLGVCVWCSLLLGNAGAQDCRFVDFTYQVGSNGEVQFKDVSTVATPLSIASRSWAFGDGAISSLVAPSHTYTIVGATDPKLCFDVTLTVTFSNNETETVTKEVCMTIPTADGDLTVTILSPTCPIELAQGQSLTFEASVIGGTAPYDFAWDFDDGTNANTNPTNPISFDKAGPFTVVVTATDALGNTGTTTCEVIVGEEAIGKIDFTYPSETCINEYTTFTPIAPPTFTFIDPVEIIWDFGDGTQSTAVSTFADISHTYLTTTTTNPYKVSFTITDALGSYTATHDIIVNSQCTTSTTPSDPCDFKVFADNNGPNKYQIYDVYYPTPPSPFIIHYNESKIVYFFILPTSDEAKDDSYVVYDYPSGAFMATGQGIKFDINYTGNPPGCYGLVIENKTAGCIAQIIEKAVCIEAAPFKIESITTQCKGASLPSIEATVTGGYTICGTPDKPYKSYAWKFYNINNIYQEITDFVMGSPNNPSVTINDKSTYFTQFGTGGPVSIVVELSVEDCNNNETKMTKVVTFTPFHGYIDGKAFFYYTAPYLNQVTNPDVTCDDPLKELKAVTTPPVAVGGTPPYTYDWSSSDFFSPNNESNPSINVNAISIKRVPATVTIKDANGCVFIQKFDIQSTEEFNKPELGVTEIKVCTKQSMRTIGPTNLANLGGSGEYYFQWKVISPTKSQPQGDLKYLSDPYSAFPTVTAKAGEPLVFILIVTDKQTGCYVQSEPITIYPIDTPNIEIGDIAPKTAICYGAEQLYKIEVTNLPSYNTMFWKSLNPNFNDYERRAVKEVTLDIGTNVSTHPGIFQYNLTIVDNETGCAVSKAFDVETLGDFLYRGYESVAMPAIAGQPVSLWKSNVPFDNHIYSHKENPSSGFYTPRLSMFILNSPPVVNTNSSIFNLNHTIYNSGVFTPSKEHPYTKLIVTGANGCKKELKSNVCYILKERPKLYIHSDKQVLCKNDKLCLDFLLDLNLLSNNQGLFLPQTVNATFTVTDYGNYIVGNTTILKSNLLDTKTITLKLTDGVRGIYELKGFCWDDSKVIFPSSTGNRHTRSYTANIVGDLPNAQLSGLSSPTAFAASYDFNYGVTYLQAETTACTSSAAIAFFAKEIRAGGAVCNGKDYIISNTSKLVGGKSGFVEMLPDLCLIKPGAVFHAYLDGCPNPEALGRVAQETEIVPQRYDEQEVVPIEIPTLTTALQLHPNPFSSEVTIGYQINTEGEATTSLKVLDITGKVIAVIFEQQQRSAGKYSYLYDTKSLNAGIYFYQLEVNGQKTIQRGLKL